MASQTNPHVLIIGAGLGGLTLAQVLCNRGISFEIFERDAQYARSQGWGIGLHGVLDELMANVSSDMPPIEVVDHLQPFDLPPSAMYYNNADGSRVGVVGARDRSIIRADRQRLHSWLSTGLSIQWQKRVVSIDEDEDAGNVTAHFADGTSATGSLLVGADGMHSAVRGILLDRTGTRDPLKVLPFETLHAELVLSGEAFERQLSLSHSVWRVATDTDSSGPGVTLFAGLGKVLPDCRSANYFWYLSSESPEFQLPDRKAEEVSREKLLEMARKVVARLQPQFREVVELTEPGGIAWPPFVTSAVVLDKASLPLGRVTLLGDAAHGMPPYRGESGVQAMRDSIKLADTISQISDTKATGAALKELMGAYRDEMLERGQKSVRASIAASTANNVGRVIWGHQTREFPPKKISLADIPLLK
ncbi:hypothetical protein DL766_004484 [Monosporascus sp. MC13-8B]|uniref:FAD-binding domain-containing protein n=1 Tax=Monosporascus cannonballus TaxID=155416 RepID=A0ABY0H0B3_9PEZI|nr:hypothetical protein DL762_007179 [Monosporascus cannonballus]RYO86139.1 hypothetical protein DL763_006832 [Monosporascus cannonballus]RYP31176.1 hypothetical protein DL766_004484 [Monosporascus sp. MC13-8B]